MAGTAVISKDYVDFLRNLASVAAAHKLRASDAVADYGLNPCEISILTCLALDSTIHTVRDIALYLHTSKSLISRSTEHLRQLGFIRTAPSLADRRVLCLQLLDAAQPVVQTLKACIDAFIAEATAGIPKAEMAAFRQTAVKILKNIQHAGPDSPAADGQ